MLGCLMFEFDEIDVLVLIDLIVLTLNFVLIVVICV